MIYYKTGCVYLSAFDIMATWNRVSNFAKASVSKIAEPEKTVEKPVKKPEFVGVKYSTLVERVTILENSSFKSMNPARLEAQLNRVERKMKETYFKAVADGKKFDEQKKKLELADERLEALIKKYELKLSELEERTEDILDDAKTLKKEVKEMRDTTVNSSFDSVLIYHNLKQTAFRADGDYTIEEKAQIVREHVF